MPSPGCSSSACPSSPQRASMPTLNILVVLCSFQYPHILIKIVIVLVLKFPVPLWLPGCFLGQQEEWHRWKAGTSCPLSCHHCSGLPLVTHLCCGLTEVQAFMSSWRYHVPPGLLVWLMSGTALDIKICHSLSFLMVLSHTGISLRTSFISDFVFPSQSSML